MAPRPIHGLRVTRGDYELDPLWGGTSAVAHFESGRVRFQFTVDSYQFSGNKPTFACERLWGVCHSWIVPFYPIGRKHRTNLMTPCALFLALLAMVQDGERIREWIRELGDKAVIRRDEAERELIKIGVSAYEDLFRAAGSSSDPEARVNRRRPSSPDHPWGGMDWVVRSPGHRMFSVEGKTGWRSNRRAR